MPSYAPPKPVTTPRNFKSPRLPPPLAAHWPARAERMQKLLTSMQAVPGDELWRHHVARAQAHLVLLRNVVRNTEYSRIFRLVELEVSYGLGLSRPRNIK